MRILLLIYGVIFTLFPALGQVNSTREYRVEQFTDEQGLPQNSVRSIVRDELGFIWLATEGGLVRYDGKTFLNFPKKLLGIESDRFYQFQKGSSNRKIYAVSEFDRAILVKGGSAKVDSANFTVRDIDRQLLNAFVRLKLASPEMVNRTLSKDFQPHHLTLVGNDSRQFAAFNENIVMFDSGKPSAIVPFPGLVNLETSPKPGDSSLNIRNLVLIDNDLFYHLSGRGIEFLHITARGKNKVSLLGDITRHPQFTNKSQRTLIFANRINNQLIAVLDNSVYLVSFDAASGKLTTRFILDSSGILGGYASSYYFNKSDDMLFVGGQTAGLLVFSRKRLKTNTIKEPGYQNIFYAHVAINDSTVLTPDGQVATANGFKPMLFEQGLVDKGLNGAKVSICRDLSGSIWFRTRMTITQTAPPYFRSSFRWTTLKEPSRIYQGIDSTIWVGYRDGEIASYEPHNPLQPFRKRAFPGADVTFLYQYQRDTLWIGTYWRGLFYLNTRTNKLYHIAATSGKNIRSIISTGSGNLWISTHGEGIFLLRGRAFTPIESDSRRYLDYAHCLVPDGRGNFWISSNKGLFLARIRDMIDFADRKTHAIFYRYYDKSDGLLINEFNGGCQPCGNKLKNGYVTMPSMNGLVFIPPETSLSSSLTNPFIFDQVRVDGQSIQEKDTIKLNYNFGFLSINLAAPFFLNRNNLNIFYSIATQDGTSAKMVRVGEDLKIDIYNLPAGNHELNIHKITGFGNSYIAKKLLLRVSPAWYTQLWFLVSAAILLALLLVAYSRWRTRVLLARNRKLSLLIEDRTRELSSAMEKLVESDATLHRQLHVQMRMIGVLSHDMRSPLKYLTDYSKKMFEALASQPAPLAEMSRDISESISQIYQLTENLLGYIKTTMKNSGSVDESDIVLLEVFENKASLFIQLAKEKGTEIIIDCAPGILVRTNRQFLEIIIHNLLDNAIKSSWQDKIKLEARDSNGKLEIIISDSIGGIPDDIVNWLITPVSDQSPSLPPDIGLGLIMVKELSGLLGLAISVSSDDTGTIFVLKNISTLEVNNTQPNSA